MSSINEINEALNYRYATKAFDSSKVLPADLKEALIQSLPLAPSSFGMQLWKFFIVEDSAVREKLTEVSWGQKQVVDSDFHVVFAVDTVIDEARVDKWVNRMAEVQGTPEQSKAGFKGAVMGFLSSWSAEEKIEWAKKQAYIALGQFMTAAALLKVDTCPMEGIDAGAYDEILGLKEKGFTTAVACSVGYRSADDKYATTPKARFTNAEMIEFV